MLQHLNHLTGEWILKHSISVDGERCGQNCSMFGYEADTVVYIYTFYLQHTKHIFHGRFSLDGTGWFIVTERYVAFSYASLKCFLICVCLNSISWYTEDDATLSFSRTFNHASFNSQHSTHSVGWSVGYCKVVAFLSDTLLFLLLYHQTVYC